MSHPKYSLRQLFFLLIISLTTCISAKNIASIDEKIAIISNKVEQYAAQGKFHGSILIAHQQELKYHVSTGENGNGVKNESATRIELASMGKMFTGIAIAQLVASNKLHYNDKIGDYLEDYTGLYTHKELTIHQLLTHSTGLPDIFSFNFIERITKEQSMTVETYFEHFADSPYSTTFFENLPLELKPGSQFQYSNSGYLILGLITEKVSGLDYAAYINEHILKIAQMEETTVTSSYGGGQSTMEDLLRFYKALQEHKLISTIEQQVVFAPKIKMGKGKYYAYGFEVDERYGSTIIGHKGGSAASKAQFLIFPEKDCFALIYANNNQVGYKEFNKLRDFIRKVLS